MPFPFDDIACQVAEDCPEKAGAECHAEPRAASGQRQDEPYAEKAGYPMLKKQDVVLKRQTLTSLGLAFPGCQQLFAG